MRGVKQIISRLGWDSIVLIFISLITFISSINVIKIEDTWRDVCISFISAVVVFVITTTIPRYCHRKAKAIFLKDRIWQIIKGGGYVFNNITTMEYLQSHPGMAYSVIPNTIIEEECKKLNLRVKPSVFLMPDEEVDSWTSFFNRYLIIINRSVIEMVSIADQEDVRLVNTCESIRKIVENIIMYIDINLTSKQKSTEVSGRVISKDLQKIADHLRELEQYYNKM